MDPSSTLKSPDKRFSYSLAYEENNKRVILFGGFAPGKKFDDTWSWDGHQWELLSSSGPVARDSAAITYDNQRKCIFLFGGHLHDDRFENDTWQWKDDQWTQIDVSGPPARNHSSMVYFPELGKTILFGGRSKTEDLGDTWAWDGTTWQQLDIEGPPPRDGYRMVYDSAPKKIVLFGGRVRSQNKLSQLGDTWEFDGAKWTQVNIPGPEPRSHHGMAYDHINKTTILFGGLNNATPYFDDLWQWDGQSWKILDTTCPPPRARISMTSQANGNILLFGGDSSLGPKNDTWEMDKENIWEKHNETSFR